MPNSQQLKSARWMWVMLSLFALFVATSLFRESVYFFLFWSAVYIGACFANRWVVLYVLLSSIFLFAPTKLDGDALSLTDVVILAVAVRVLVSSRTVPRTHALKTGSRSEQFLLYSFLAIGLISLFLVVLQGRAAAASVKSFARLIEYAALYFCLCRLLCDRLSVQAAERFLIIAAFLCSLLGIWQMLLGPDVSMAYFSWGPWWTGESGPQTFRVYSVFSNPIYLSTFCAFFVPFTLDHFLHSIGTRRLNYAVILIAILVCLLATLSRTGLLGALVGMLVVLGKNWRKSIVPALIVILVLSWAASDFLIERALGRSLEANLNVYMRLVAAIEAGRIISENPITGVGLGQYQNYVLAGIADPGVPDEAITAENTFLQFGAELGIAGALIFLGFLAVILRRSRDLNTKAFPGDRGLWAGAWALFICNWFASMTAVSMMLFLFCLVALVKRKHELYANVQPQAGLHRAA